jgi:hypothetical protein
VELKLSQDEMLALVERIFKADGTEAEADADVKLFIANCSHPNGSDLIFWPDQVPDYPPGHEPTAAEVVALAMGALAEPDAAADKARKGGFG